MSSPDSTPDRGPFTTREAAVHWLRANQLEHLQHVSAGVLSTQFSRYRLIDLASDEGIAKQKYDAHNLARQGLPAQAWRYFEQEAVAGAEAQHDAENRLALPSAPRAFDLHRSLVALRAGFGTSVPARANRQLELDRLELKPELPGFVLADPLRWELPGHFGFIEPVTTVRAEAAGASALCTCGLPRCIHALAAIDTILLWLHQAPSAVLEEFLSPPWDKALRALDGIFAGGPRAAPDELTWRLSVSDDEGLDLTPWLRGKSKVAPQKLAQALNRPPSAGDATLAELCVGKNGAALLAAMVGHPRIVLASNPLRSVSVVRTAVGLVAEERLGSVALTLGVDGTSLPETLVDRVRRNQFERPLFLWDEGACTLEQLELSREVREAFAVLTRYGNLFPPESQPALLAQLTRAATQVPVAMPRSVLGQAISSQLTRVLRLERQPSGAVRIEIRIRPLPESEALLPAEGPRDVHVRRDGRPFHAVRRSKDEMAAATELVEQLPLRNALPVAAFCYELDSANDALELISVCAQLTTPPVFEWVGPAPRVVGHASPRQL